MHTQIFTYTWKINGQTEGREVGRREERELWRNCLICHAGSHLHQQCWTFPGALHQHQCLVRLTSHSVSLPWWVWSCFLLGGSPMLPWWLLWLSPLLHVYHKHDFFWKVSICSCFCHFQLELLPLVLGVWWFCQGYCKCVSQSVTYPFVF